MPKCQENDLLIISSYLTTHTTHVPGSAIKSHIIGIKSCYIEALTEIC